MRDGECLLTEWKEAAHWLGYFHQGRHRDLPGHGTQQRLMLDVAIASYELCTWRTWLVSLGTELGCWSRWKTWFLSLQSCTVAQSLCSRHLSPGVQVSWARPSSPPEQQWGWSCCLPTRGLIQQESAWHLGCCNGPRLVLFIVLVTVGDWTRVLLYPGW
jgi:hypothetical protein